MDETKTETGKAHKCHVCNGSGIIEGRSKPRVKGISIEMNGETFVVPALNTGAVRSTREVRAKLKDIDVAASDLGDEQLDAIHSFILAALRRNYPELTLEDMDDLVDLDVIPDLIQAITAQTGLRKGGAPGAEPIAAAPSPTGAESTH